jgi:hypothetical protein
VPWTLHLSKSFARRDHPILQSRRLASWVGLLLFGTGCPQLLDDPFAGRDSPLSLPDAAAGGGCAAGVCVAGAAGRDAGGDGGRSGVGGSGVSSGGTSGNGGAGGASPDGTIAERRSCPFGEPEPLLGLDVPASSEWGASSTADGLTLYFARSEAGNSDLYRATRADRGVTFSTPIALAGLNTADDDGTPLLSSDGLRLYFYSSRAGGPGGKDLYVATRSDVAAEFENPQLLANVNSEANDHLPRLSSDELTLWFTSSRAGGPGAADLWTASRASIDAEFGVPTVFSNVNGSSGDESGSLTQDGLFLIFDSTREGLGNNEIFTTTRTSVEQDFPAPVPLSAVNSATNEYNVFLTPDERELFFSSNRPLSPLHHLFRSLRRCE